MAQDTTSPNPTPDTQPTPPRELPVRGRLLAQLIAQTPVIAAVSVTVLFCLIIGSLFFPYLFGYQSESSLLRELASLDQARGLITFLVAVTTVGIALILTVFVVVTDDPGVKDKFVLGKEVLTGLIGVLGTIVGFYFGSVASQTSTAPPAPKIAAFTIEPSTAKAGAPFKVVAKVTGVKAPIEYAISFKSDPEIKTKTGISQSEDISEDFAIPEKATAGSKIEVLLSVKDKSGKVIDAKLLPIPVLTVSP